jgi:hypothetical protein
LFHPVCEICGNTCIKLTCPIADIDVPHFAHRQRTPSNIDGPTSKSGHLYLGSPSWTKFELF